LLVAICKTSAKELDVSVSAICFHMRRIDEKLQVHSKSEALIQSPPQGLIAGTAVA